MPDEVRVEAAKRYIKAYEQVTGLDFEPVAGDINARVASALGKL